MKHCKHLLALNRLLNPTKHGGQTDQNKYRTKNQNHISNACTSEAAAISRGEPP